MGLAEDIGGRLDAVRAWLGERGLAGVLVAFNGQHYMLRFNALLYLTGFKPMGPALLFVPSHGDPVLTVSPEWDAARARAAAPSCTVEAVAEEALAKRVAARFGEHGGRLAIAGFKQVTSGFSKAAGLNGQGGLTSADDFLSGLARIHSAYEIDCVSKAARIADLGFSALCDAARVGMTEFELAAEIEYAMQCAGSEDNYGLLSTGPHNQSVRAPTDRRLEAGDVIIGEITPCHGGYFAQLCRTLVLGEPTALQKEKYDLVVRAHDLALDQVRAGNSSSAIAEAANAVFSENGYEDYCRPPYMRTRGHGLGFGGIAPSDISVGNPVTLEPGMSMVVHPNQYIPEVGYMMMGDTVVVEEQGARCLTGTARRLFWKEA